jgi:hypothetical protein
MADDHDQQHENERERERERYREHTERIAREAARLYHEGKAGSVAESIRKASQQVGLHGSDAPSAGKVRRHVQAMSMQAMGSDAYAAAMKERLRGAEQLMSALDEYYAGVPMFLVGRGAKGQLDGDLVLHVRIYTDAPIKELAQTLVDLGYDEPKFETVNTRHGRLNRLRFEDDDAEILLTRCLPAMLKSAQQDLFTNAPIATLTLKQLREQLDS